MISISVSEPFGAEPWTESMRKEIEERLGLKGYNIYGLSEIMGPWCFLRMSGATWFAYQ